ncbi:hypothetical protein OH76DRAFT_796710 [Lentinus brumalis]|uniref:Uncharacterized protein n=1 Tax=Lentinus brumalis TaxID=2498619 RepID=A0A371D3P6_9APHY|nr:hypothetical protein OH76DRAFT_796710 [Polyporus brumalis]
MPHLLDAHPESVYRSSRSGPRLTMPAGMSAELQGALHHKSHAGFTLCSLVWTALACDVHITRLCAAEARLRGSLRAYRVLWVPASRDIWICIRWLPGRPYRYTSICRLARCHILQSAAEVQYAGPLYVCSKVSPVLDSRVLRGRSRSSSHNVVGGRNAHTPPVQT